MPRPRFRLTSKGKIPYIEAEEKLAEKTTPVTEEGPQNTLLEALAKPVE